MSIPYRERRLLWQRAKALRATDPHLAAMLAVFAQITAAEVLPPTEQIRSRWPGLLLAVAALAAGVARRVVRLIRAAARGVRRGSVRFAIGLGTFCQRLVDTGPTRRPSAPSARQ